MMHLIFLICLSAIATKNYVFSFGEDDNFTELVNMVDKNIEASLNYAFPKDNSDLLQVRSPIVKDYGTYDFIVVGSGAGGAVVANRLSEISDWKVLLLEAGGEDSNFTKILGLYAFAVNSRFNWGYKTVSQKHACLGKQNKQCQIDIGKVLGGGTTINEGAYARGHADDFNRWANLYQNPGWSYEEVLPYFKKSENAVFSPRDEHYHDVNGYFTVDQVDLEKPDLVEVMTKGLQEVGEIGPIDYNGEIHNGFGINQLAIKGNERVSAASAFLHNFRNRTNLEISTNSFVTQVLIDENNKAYGVSFVKNGTNYIAYAGKEVIVSAGAINSAQLLMLSGVGPKEHLTKLGIPVKKNLPVGRNFQDHVQFTGVFFRAKKNISSEITLVELLQQYVQHKGSLVPSITDTILGFTNFGKNNSRRSDVEYIIRHSGFGSDLTQLLLRLDNSTANITNPFADIVIQIFLLNIKSRGCITLESRDPRDRPIIDPNYLAEPEDIENLYEEIQFLLALNNTEALKKYGAEIVVIDHPNCKCLEKFTKKWWICCIQHFSGSALHPVASNTMGPNPETSVVNARLKVHEIERLRVVDGSILPEGNSAHLMAPIMMVGEKAADMIKEDWKIL